MSSPLWYWHRLRAMGTAELAAHARRKIHQVSDNLWAGRRFASVADIPPGRYFPELPFVHRAPEELQERVRKDLADILAGRWVAFGQTILQVDNPPKWHKDYLAGVDMATDRPALRLHHRLEGKADIKLIWEPSRWYSLVRLAQAACLLADESAASACLKWLNHWVEKNPPFYGWNWLSGLETGIRLIQFAWIDLLLSGMASGETPARQARHDTLARLRARILPPHLWYTWRDRSFGSSANNHLIGELAGLIVTLVRWPDLARWAAPLDTLQPLWEREVLAQFAPDGGNREQALNYHLFSWEFCWQTRLALTAAGRAVSPDVEDRLRTSAAFFTNVQVEQNQWDYGDSDNAYVTPLFQNWPQATAEWHAWLRREPSGASIRYWIGDPPKPFLSPIVRAGAKGWQIYSESGYALCRSDDWVLRWDLSPLGYLRTAGHGHCDALHLSVWFRGEPLLIDPGTGAYHADRKLRDYLASWEAHNGPHSSSNPVPVRSGTFLWTEPHGTPRVVKTTESEMTAELELPHGLMRRSIARGADLGWEIHDAFVPRHASGEDQTIVFWQFAPGWELIEAGRGEFRLASQHSELKLEFDTAWGEISFSGKDGLEQPSRSASLMGTCSPGFRLTASAPFVRLQSKPGAGGEFFTRLVPVR